MSEELFEKVRVDENYVRVSKDDLFNFIVRIFVKLGVPEEHARMVADNLVMADLHGIESHGVQRLKRYVDGIRKGGVNIKPNIKIVKEGSSYALVDGDEGLGQVVGTFAMKLAIEKAKKTGIGVVVVRNSNHYGIAGYYALMAAKENLIGISMTNSRPLVAPTWGIERLLGTNPIALAAPMEKGYFLLDMATSVVPSGKLEVYRRKGKRIPEGWAMDKDGNITTNPEDFFVGGALLPLGGFGELHGGHKGYGLSLMVDILSGLLSGGTWSKYVGNTSEKHSNVCHFFMAINIEHFIPLDEFKKKITGMTEEIKNSKKHPEATRIWIHGEKGFLTEKTRLKIGVPIYKKVFEEINRIAEELGVEKLKPMG